MMEYHRAMNEESDRGIIRIYDKQNASAPNTILGNSSRCSVNTAE